MQTPTSEGMTLEEPAVEDQVETALVAPDPALETLAIPVVAPAELSRSPLSMYGNPTVEDKASGGMEPGDIKTGGRQTSGRVMRRSAQRTEPWAPCKPNVPK
jgi:hypothetical protein